MKIYTSVLLITFTSLILAAVSAEAKVTEQPEVTDVNHTANPVNPANGLHSISATHTLTLKIDSAGACSGSRVTLAVRVWNFKNMLSAQGTIVFDPAVITYTGVEQPGLPYLNSNSFGTKNVSSGKLSFVWMDYTLSGVSVPDSTVIVALNFNVTGASGQQSLVQFSNVPTLLEFIDTGFSALQANFTGGDSTVTPNLTVNHSSTSSLLVDTCGKYIWHGATYTTSGTYIYHATNAAGCDSAVTLQLTITGTCASTLNLKMYLQGYYQGGGMMTPVLLNEGVSGNAGVVDTIIVSLVDSTSLKNNGDDEYNATVASAKGILHIDGTLSVTFTCSLSGHSYYIRLNHRNTIETWSSRTILPGITTDYDFTANAGQAYGSNEIDVYNEGIWSLFTGDMNQDQNIDIYDFPTYDYESLHFYYGYFNTDLNGDGNVDIYDFPVFDLNSQNFIYSIYP